MNTKLSPINELNGIIPSLHTPFKNNKSIDYKSLEKLVLHTIDKNCAGMLLSAVAGETQNLTFNEKAEMMEFVLDISCNIIPVIFGCSSQKIEEIYSLVDLARQKKIKWVLIQAPLNLDESDLIVFYKKINEIGPSHLMIQDLSWDSYGLSHKTIQNLTVLKINDVEDLLYVKGSVPGPKNGYLTVRDAIKSKLPENALKPAGLKEIKKPESNTSDQKEVVQDEEVSIKSENVEVKDKQTNDQKASEQTITSVDELSNAEITDADKNTDNNEV